MHTYNMCMRHPYLISTRGKLVHSLPFAIHVSGTLSRRLRMPVAKRDAVWNMPAMLHSTGHTCHSSRRSSRQMEPPPEQVCSKGPT